MMMMMMMVMLIKTVGTMATDREMLFGVTRPGQLQLE
jgi:hypothetical protein